jgi:prefoldin subunit 5
MVEAPNLEATLNTLKDEVASLNQQMGDLVQAFNELDIAVKRLTKRVEPLE